MREESRPPPKEQACAVLRVVGLKRAICWLKQGGCVLEVEVNAPVGRELFAAHMWRPVPAVLVGEVEWDSARGVLTADALTSSPLCARAAEEEEEAEPPTLLLVVRC